MKYAIFALLLTGCLLSPEPKTVHRDVSVGPECLKQATDTTTWTDTSQTDTRTFTCEVGP